MMVKFLIPAVMTFALVAAVQSLTPQPQAEAVPLITEVVQAEATGPGFFPAPKDDADCKCANCNCGELEKRVAALETKVASYGTARPVESNGSAGESAGVAFRPSTTAGLPYGAVVTGERVISSRPTATLRTPDYQSGQPVRNVVRGVAVGVRNTTCRFANGVEICN